MKRILWIGDVHSGSNVAVKRDDTIAVDVQTGERIKVPSNNVQTKFFELWEKMVKDIGKVDICVVNGDLCDGPQKKNEGKGTWTTDLNDQVNECVELLRMIRAKKFYVTLGSGYHTGENAPLDQVVAERLNHYIPTTFLNELKLDLKKEDVSFHVQHFISISNSTWQYRTTSVARDMVLLKLNDSIQNYGKIDCMVRSHAHFYVACEYSSQIGFVTPGWQGKTPFAVKHGMITPPEIGYVVTDVEKGIIDRYKVATRLTLPCRVVSE